MYRRFILPSTANQNPQHSYRKPSLTLVNVNQVNIPPKEKVIYNKQTQTAATGQDRDGKGFQASKHALNNI